MDVNGLFQAMTFSPIGTGFTIGGGIIGSIIGYYARAICISNCGIPSLFNQNTECASACPNWIVYGFIFTGLGFIVWLVLKSLGKVN